jgi:hypothetical protein
MTPEQLQEMRARAMRWIEPGNCAPVTRSTALNEEHLALDVMELLDEVAAWSGIADHAVAELERIINLPHACGWCIRAAGDTDEARKAAQRFSLDEIRSHTVTCEHNPLVRQLWIARKALEEMAASCRAPLSDYAREALKEMENA